MTRSQARLWVVISALLGAACSENAPGAPADVAGGGGGAGTAAGSTAGSAGAPPTGQAGSNQAGSLATSGAGGSAAGGTDSAAGGGASGGAESGRVPDDALVVLFVIDGLQTKALETAIESGATQLRALVEGGVSAEASYSTSPAPRLELPDDSLPWGNATSGNVAVHTGCHLFESSQMDDIFLAARTAGIRSVFAGGDANYGVFTSADFEYSGNISDEAVVQHGITHLQADGVRLMRLHLQRIRDDWEGPASQSNASSPYIEHLLAIDGLLGQLRQALEAQGVADRTYLILSSDHGMGQSGSSEHPSSTLSSWQNVTVFHGPGVKQGATIPYAELPDLAVMTNHLLKLPALRGHTDPSVMLARKGATGTLLTNIFEGQPSELDHPRYIEQYLNTGTYTDSDTGYSDYRLGMLELLE